MTSEHFRPAQYQVDPWSDVPTDGLSLAACLGCGHLPIRIAWDECPTCMARLMKAVLVIGHSRSKAYAHVCDLARSLPGYTVTGEGPVEEHRIPIDVRNDDYKTYWDLCVHAKWSNTRVEYCGRLFIPHFVHQLFWSYRWLVNYSRTMFTPPGRGVWLEFNFQPESCRWVPPLQGRSHE